METGNSILALSDDLITLPDPVMASTQVPKVVKPRRGKNSRNREGDRRRRPGRPRKVVMPRRPEIVPPRVRPKRLAAMKAPYVWRGRPYIVDKSGPVPVVIPVGNRDDQDSPP